MEFLQKLIMLLILFSSYFMLQSKNPIHSALSLMLAFFFSAILLLTFKVEFLGMLFIIIYVGAIAILFLFVIMLVTVKEFALSKSAYAFMFLISSFLFSTQFYLLFSTIFNTPFPSNSTEFFDFSCYIDDISNLQAFGQVLFNYYLIHFLLVGIVLLVALVGAIVLTLEFNNTATYKAHSRQLSRTEKFLAYFKTKIV